MDQFANLAILQARSGKENDVTEFLKSARALALQEAGTVNWFAVRLGPARFAIFDTFRDIAGRDAHLKGEIARTLFARAEELFSEPPQVDQGEILASKTPRRRAQNVLHYRRRGRLASGDVSLSPWNKAETIRSTVFQRARGESACGRSSGHRSDPERPRDPNRVEFARVPLRDQK